MHTDIKKLYVENCELKKEVQELKSMMANSNQGGSKNKRRINYDSSWLMVVYYNFFIIYCIS
jgi:hypothetical protein